MSIYISMEKAVAVFNSRSVKENLSVKNTEKLVKVVNVANKLPLDASVSISRWSKFLSPKKFTKSQQRLIQQEHH